MKTVKNKLFAGFTIVIFLILSLLSYVAIEFFAFNEENESFTLIDNTSLSAKAFVEKNGDDKIYELDKYITLKYQFLIILKDGKIIFTNESNYKTNRLLDEFYDDLQEELSQRGYQEHIFEEGYILNSDIVEKQGSIYEILVGIDDDIIEEDIADIVFMIILLNITLFIILLALGHLLISRTIKPLKLILEELNSLEEASDLSKRLKELKTNDEFEKLVNTFNKMLNNIENSVENIKQFTSDASHELKTPITVIQGEIELVKDKELSKEQMNQTLEKIDVEQKKLQEIIKNFLLLSRLDKEVVKNSKTSLDKALFESIEQNLEAMESKNLELKLDIAENLEVSFGEKYLNIVINNLLTNAIKYTNDGFIEIKAKKENQRVVLEMIDSGIGISNSDQKKIFERFYRVDKVRTSSKDGIGLGLSIVKKICERFDAKISLKSKIEEGTTFKVMFKS